MGSVSVANDALFADLATEAYAAEVAREQKRALNSTKQPRRVDLLAQQLENKRKYREHLHKENEKRVQERLERKLREDQLNKERRFQRSINNIVRGEEELLPEIDDTLNQYEKAEQRKREQLYRDWSEQVYDKIHGEIRDRLDSIPIHELERRKNRLYDEYLKTANRKEGVFLDIIIEKDYNPLKSREYSIRYQQVSEDPVKRSLAVMEEERQQAQVAAQKLKGIDEKATAGEKRFDVKMWDKLDATPHGRYQKMMDSADASTSDSKQKLLKSSVHMDHFDFPTSNQAAQSEFGAGGKRVYPNWKPMPRKGLL